jgi:hypothetical protein
MCHDYKSAGRVKYAWETTVQAQREKNKHVHDGMSRAYFVAMRWARDAQLPMPKLLLPSIQVNMRAGIFPSQDQWFVVFEAAAQRSLARKTKLEPRKQRVTPKKQRG